MIPRKMTPSEWRATFPATSESLILLMQLELGFASWQTYAHRNEVPQIGCHHSSWFMVQQSKNPGKGTFSVNWATENPALCLSSFRWWPVVFGSP